MNSCGDSTGDTEWYEVPLDFDSNPNTETNARFRKGREEQSESGESKSRKTDDTQNSSEIMAGE